MDSYSSCNQDDEKTNKLFFITEMIWTILSVGIKDLAWIHLPPDFGKQGGIELLLPTPNDIFLDTSEYNW